MAAAFVLLAQAALPELRVSAAPAVVVISSFIAHRYVFPPAATTGFTASAGAKAPDEGHTASFPHPTLVYTANPYRDRK